MEEGKFSCELCVDPHLLDWAENILIT